MIYFGLCSVGKHGNLMIEYLKLIYFLSSRCEEERRARIVIVKKKVVTHICWEWDLFFIYYIILVSFLYSNMFIDQSYFCLFSLCHRMPCLITVDTLQNCLCSIENTADNFLSFKTSSQSFRVFLCLF